VRDVVDRSWFDRPVLHVAHDLLCARLKVKRPDGTVTVRLTEVEAYGGPDDPGSHAYRGRTPRNAAMFGAPGHLYVYRHMGLHRCANVVTGPVGTASAVLLRAGQVVDGVEVARRRRLAEGVVHREQDLARGPARLAVSLALMLDDDGMDLLADEVQLSLPSDGRSIDAGQIGAGPRVGVAAPGDDATRFPWRLWLLGDSTVSSYRAATRRSAGAHPARRAAD
jgi:DNA-3-methyladenine glycosylase